MTAHDAPAHGLEHDHDRLHCTPRWSAEPLTARCRTAFDAREHAVLGISPFNSYYSEERIRELVEWGLQTFRTVHLFVPDEPSAYTLAAAGYTPADAVTKARRQANYLRNKIGRALEGLGISASASDEMLAPWSRVSTNPQYQAGFARGVDAYERDPAFRHACRATASWVLQRRTSESSGLAPEAIEGAVRYLLAELPLFIDSVGIFGQRASVFCYHQSVPFLQDLFGECFGLTVVEGQGFLRVRLSDETDREAVSVATPPVAPARLCSD